MYGSAGSLWCAHRFALINTDYCVDHKLVAELVQSELQALCRRILFACNLGRHRNCAGIQPFFDPMHCTTHRDLPIPQFPECWGHAPIFRNPSFMQIQSAEDRYVKYALFQDRGGEREPEVGVECRYGPNGRRGVYARIAQYFKVGQFNEFFEGKLCTGCARGRRRAGGRSDAVAERIPNISDSAPSVPSQIAPLRLQGRGQRALRSVNKNQPSYAREPFVDQPDAFSGCVTEVPCEYHDSPSPSHVCTPPFDGFASIERPLSGNVGWPPFHH